MGLTVVPSDANFVMVVLEDDAVAAELVEGLLRHGIVVRPLRSFGLPHCVRISTGTDDQVERCVEALQSVLPALSR